jgi:hypothetical protein
MNLEENRILWVQALKYYTENLLKLNTGKSLK